MHLQLSAIATVHGVNAEVCEVIGFCCSEQGLHPLAYHLFVTYRQSNPRPSKVLVQELGQQVSGLNNVHTCMHLCVCVCVCVNGRSKEAI